MSRRYPWYLAVNPDNTTELRRTIYEPTSEEPSFEAYATFHATEHAQRLAYELLHLLNTLD